MAVQQLRRAPGSSGLYDVLELILDRGLVIDAYARVSLVGIELITVDLRVVVASVDTYLRYAEAMERLGWHERERSSGVGLPDMVGDGMTKRAVHRGTERVADAVTGRQSGSNGAGNGRGATSALASGAHTVAEATGSALSRGAEKLKHTISGDHEGNEASSRNESQPHGEGHEPPSQEQGDASEPHPPGQDDDEAHQ